MIQPPAALQQWVEESARLTQPDRVVWLHGGKDEYRSLIDAMLSERSLIRLNADAYPNCFLHRSHPNDVARTENLTFICTSDREDAGPTNNWMSPEEGKERLTPLFRGAMKGRTMYVIPYLLGPAHSPFAQIGCELTDSSYVAASMHLMTRVGDVALDHIQKSEHFVGGLHSLGDLDPTRRYVMHFPEEQLIWSIGSGYGGNALLAKKCHALRIASAMARDQGWMAEHMLILGLERPGKETIYMAGAFPSACGKTNLAMLRYPEFEEKGYRVWTVGDDIAWLRIGEDGRLWAVNPEAGFFGVVPGTNWETNDNAMASMQHDALFTNVAVTPEGDPWWEGMTDAPPPGLLDWKGEPWNGQGPAAHPNARFTAPITNCPSLSPHYGDPQGVPISVILFGGRRAHVAPLVFETFGWEHAVFVGSGMGSETTAASTGERGVVRRDPMAMLPFCGYHMGDYFAHWLEMGERIPDPPAVYHVNWFRKDEEGKYLWPGFDHNLRVLLWIADRLEGNAGARSTPIGNVPRPEDLCLDELDLSDKVSEELFRVDNEAWQREADDLEAFYARLGDRLPEELPRQLLALRERLREG